MKRLILAFALTAFFVTAATARPAADQEQQLSPAAVKMLNDLAAKAQALPTKVAPIPPPPAVDPPPVVVTPTPSAPVGVPPAPPVTQNTVTTTGPVSSETSISIGTLAGQVLTWATLAFGSVISTYLAAYIRRLLKNAGIQGGEFLSDKLDRIIVNGINSGAALATQNLAGKGQVEIKNAAVAYAVAYAQDHGAEAIKQLGLDPKNGAAVEAIKARIETAIADPTVPTPAVLDPTPAAPAVPKAA